MTHPNPPRLAIIAPCLNEADVLPSTIGALSLLLSDMVAEDKVAPDSFLLFVDDGSSDDTWKIICRVASPEVRGIRLSRRCGHQAALLAGMAEALPEMDACVTIDADLQDDIRVVPDMVSKFREGADIVYGVRSDRHGDAWVKKHTAEAFYATMRGLGVECVSNHADFRLMSRRAVADLLEYGERNLFLRGIVPQLGYRQESVFYHRLNRVGGVSKYPFAKMVDFAIDGITSFSVRPVRMLSGLGLIFMLIGIVIGVYTLIRYFSGETIEGWTSLMLSVWFCTGVLLMGLGIIGEYIGKIYIEVKHRPLYRVAERTSDNNSQADGVNL